MKNETITVQSKILFTHSNGSTDLTIIPVTYTQQLVADITPTWLEASWILASPRKVTLTAPFLDCECPVKAVIIKHFLTV